MEGGTSPRSMRQLSLILSENIKTVELGISPLDELQLQYREGEDLDELKYILGGILTYPSTELAKLHKHANRLGSQDLKDGHQNKLTESDKQQLKEEQQFCPCCGFKKQQDPIKLCTGFDSIQNIGISTNFYFLTIKHLSILLLLLTLIYSIYALVTNIIASEAYNPDANYPTTFDEFKNLSVEEYQQIFKTLKSNIQIVNLALGSKLLDQSLQNRQLNQTLYLAQCWIGVGIVLIFGLMFIVIKNRQKSQQLEIDRMTKSAADYSIIMEKVPQGYTQEQMQQQFDRYFKQIQGISTYKMNNMKRMKIVSYNIAKPFYLDESRFDNEEINSLNERHKEMIEMFISWIEERRDQSQFSVPQEERKKYYEEYDKLLEKRLLAYKKITDEILEEFKSADKEPTTTVFITFETSFAKKVIVDENSKDAASTIRYWLTCCQDRNLFHLEDENGETVSNVRIQQAPEPQDIIWTNLGMKNSETVKRKVITFLATIFLLAISFGCVIGLSYAQIENSQDQYLSILISLVISFVNIIIQQVLRRLTLLQRDYTQTNQQASLGLKAVFALLVNSILVPIIANEAIKRNNIYGQNGLAYDVFLLGITNSFLQPILKIFDGYYYFTRIMAWFQNKPSQKLYLNQPDLNLYNEYIEFETGYEYIYFVNLFLFTCFFVSLQPIISIFAFFGMIFMYWSQKYSVLSRCKRPIPGTTAVNTAMFQLIHLGPLFFSLGNFTWSHFLTQQPYEPDPQRLIPNIIAIALSGIIFLLPYRLIFQFVFEDENEICLNYEQNKIYLPSEYDRLNPDTSKEAIQEHIKYVEQYRENVLKGKSDEELKKFEGIFNKQFQRGHHNPHILPPIFGSRQGTLKVVDQIFHPQNQQVNQLLMGQALFNNNSQGNPLQLLVQNWDTPNQKKHNNQGTQNPFIKMTESSHMMNENENEKKNGILNLLNDNPNQGNNPNLPPVPPPNMFNNQLGGGNAFNQLVYHNQNPQFQHYQGYQPNRNFPQNPYYNNQQRPMNPLGNPYNRRY